MNSSNLPYGKLENPIFLGSGGSSSCGFGSKAGNGGGRISIISDKLIINGRISANGNEGVEINQNDFSGGGSGGSIKINVGEISGTGEIEAKGGDGSFKVRLDNRRGGGGGGRIAIFYTSSNFPEDNIYVKGGFGNTGEYSGSSGTVYLKQENEKGKLIINNGNLETTLLTPLLTSISDFLDWEIKNNGTLNLEGLGFSTGINIQNQLIISSSGYLEAGENVDISFLNVNDFDILLQSKGTLSIEKGSDLKFDKLSIDNGRLITKKSLSFQSIDDLLLASNGQLEILDNSSLSIPNFRVDNIVSGIITLSKGCSLDVQSNEIVLNDSVILVKDGKFGSNDKIRKITVESGGIITHSERLIDGLILDADEEINIKEGGLINVSGKGLKGGSNGSSFDCDGESIDPSGNIIVGAKSNMNGGAGASYGGWGNELSNLNHSNQPYGNIEGPYFLGSGGASSCQFGAKGGNGGGKVFISSPMIILDGKILANGEEGIEINQNDFSGGGSGGSVEIITEKLSGGGVIKADGGNGSWMTYEDNRRCGGGGGRVSIQYNELTFSSDKVSAQGGRGDDNPTGGGSGSIFLKGKDTLPQLVLNNGAVKTNKYTPFSSQVAEFLTVSVQSFAKLILTNEFTSELGVANNIELKDSSCFKISFFPNFYQSNSAQFSISSGAKLELPPNIPIENHIQLSDGILSDDNMIFLSEKGIISGTGIIEADFLNEGILYPGGIESFGAISISGNFIQEDIGLLEIELGGYSPSSGYDLLIVDSIATLNGQLKINAIHNFKPSKGSKFEVIYAQERRDSFDMLSSALDEFGLYLTSERLGLIVDKNIIENSSTDPYIILSPSGNVDFSVNLKNVDGTPAIGSNNVWLDFSDVEGLTACESEQDFPIVYPAGSSDSLGNVFFFPKVGGCPLGKVKIMSSHGIINEVPIKSLDHNGGLRVTAHDFVKDDCSDFNFDGSVDNSDWEFFTNYLDESCIDDFTDFIEVKILTIPEENQITEGDTIQVCIHITNTLNERITIDSANINSSFFGINNRFVPFGYFGQVEIDPLAEKLLCKEFVVPKTGHGCFSTNLFPNFSISVEDFPPLNESLAYGTRKIDEDYWAYIGLENGQDFISMRFDPSTLKFDLSSLRFLNLSIDEWRSFKGNNSYFNYLLDSDQAHQARTLHDEDNLPFFNGDFQSDALIYDLSWLFNSFYFTSGLDVKRSSNISGNTDDECFVNECGPRNNRLLSTLGRLPSIPFGNCCNSHDRCYCNQNCSNTRAGCDLKFLECAAHNCEEISSISLLLAPQYLSCFLYATFNYILAAIAGNSSFNSCDPSSIKFQRNIDVKTPPQTQNFLSNNLIYRSSEEQLDTSKFQIPVGSDLGDSLSLVINSILPKAWDYEISDSTEILAPHIIDVEIIYPELLHCSDTGKVIVYAYNINEEFVGYAEVSVYDSSLKGDIDNNGIVDTIDQNQYLRYILEENENIGVPRTAELNGDLILDIGDFTKLTSIVRTGEEYYCIRDTANQESDISIFWRFQNDTTTLILSSPFDLRGLNLKLEGDQPFDPDQGFDLGIEQFFKTQNDSINIIIADLEGTILLENNIDYLFKITWFIQTY